MTTSHLPENFALSRYSQRIESLRIKINEDIAAASESLKKLRDWRQQDRAREAQHQLRLLLREIEAIQPTTKIDARTMRHMEGEAGRWARHFMRPERIAAVEDFNARVLHLKCLHAQLREHGLSEQAAKEYDELARSLYGERAYTSAEYERWRDERRRKRLIAMYGVNAFGPLEDQEG